MGQVRADPPFALVQGMPFIHPPFIPHEVNLLGPLKRKGNRELTELCESKGREKKIGERKMSGSLFVHFRFPNHLFASVRNRIRIIRLIRG